MTEHPTSHKKIIRERVKMVIDEPFFGSLALRLHPKADPTCEHMWTDGHSLGYNPEFIDSIEPQQVRGLIAKCILKCANGHPWRRGGRDQKLWMQSSELAVEKALRSMRDTDPMIVSGEGDRFYDKAAERIYSTLREEQDPDDQGDGEGEGEGEGEGQGEGQGQGQGDGEGEGQGQQPPGNAPGEVRDAPPEEDDGEGEGNAESQGEGGHPPPPADGEGEWRMAVAEAAKNQKSQGNMPAWMQRMYDEAVSSKVNWKAELMEFVMEKSKNDYTWRLPNRRFIAQGVYLPSLYDEAIGEIVFAIDTSGSVSEKELGQAAKEVQAVVDVMHPTKMHVVYCDTRVAHVDVFEKGDPISVKMHGGGGTAFQPVFDWIEKEGITPVCTIYLTDMYGTDVEDPGHPVLWLSTTKDKVSRTGRTLFIEID